jgi:flagellar motility protein MotE (MotC chaperone)
MMMNTKELGQSRLFLISILSIAMIFAGGFYYVLEGAKIWNLEQFGASSTDAQQLKAREIALNTKEKKLIEKESELRAFNRRLELRQEQWQKDREAFLVQVRQWDQVIENQKQVQNESIEKLARIYEKMDSRKAAQLMTGLDNALAARLLLKIQTYASAQILSEIVKINPEKAVQISQKMKLEILL